MFSGQIQADLTPAQNISMDDVQTMDDIQTTGLHVTAVMRALTGFDVMSHNNICNY